LFTPGDRSDGAGQPLCGLSSTAASPKARTADELSAFKPLADRFRCSRPGIDPATHHPLRGDNRRLVQKARTAAGTGAPRPRLNATYVSALAIDPLTPHHPLCRGSGACTKHEQWWGLESHQERLTETQCYALAIDRHATTLYAEHTAACSKAEQRRLIGTPPTPLGATPVMSLVIDRRAATLYAGTLYGIFKSTNGAGTGTPQTRPDQYPCPGPGDRPGGAGHLYAGTDGAACSEAWTAAGTGAPSTPGPDPYHVQELVIDPAATTHLYAGQMGRGVCDPAGGKALPAAGLESRPVMGASFASLVVNSCSPQRLALSYILSCILSAVEGEVETECNLHVRWETGGSPCATQLHLKEFC